MEERGESSQSGQGGRQGGIGTLSMKVMKKMKVMINLIGGQVRRVGRGDVDPGGPTKNLKRSNCQQGKNRVKD